MQQQVQTQLFLFDQFGSGHYDLLHICVEVLRFDNSRVIESWHETLVIASAYPLFLFDDFLCDIVDVVDGTGQ